MMKRRPHYCNFSVFDSSSLKDKQQQEVHRHRKASKGTSSAAHVEVFVRSHVHHLNCKEVKNLAFKHSLFSLWAVSGVTQEVHIPAGELGITSPLQVVLYLRNHRSTPRPYA